MKVSGLKKITIPTLCVLALSACSGGGVGSDAAAPGEIENPAAGEVEERPVDLAERRRMNNGYLGLYNDIEDNWVYPATLPKSGTAIYNGYAGFKNENDKSATSDLVAKLALNVYLGSGEATGSMWDFTDADGKQAAGSIQLEGTQGFQPSPNGGGPQGEGVAYANAEVALSGAGTLDWGDEQQVLDVALKGSAANIRSEPYVYDPEKAPAPHLENYGAKGDLTIVSTIDGVVTPMEGKFAVKNDKF